MRIIKEGRIPDVVVQFTCKICGTVWEATYRELLEDMGDIELCECPNCDYLNDSKVRREIVYEK